MFGEEKYRQFQDIESYLEDQLSDQMDQSKQHYESILEEVSQFSNLLFHSLFVEKDEKKEGGISEGKLYRGAGGRAVFGRQVQGGVETAKRAADPAKGAGGPVSLLSLFSLFFPFFV